jgi:hypothetical protein
MTSFVFILVASYSIIIAAVIGVIRLPVIHRNYQPFLLIILLSLISEVVSHLLIHYRKSNAINNNLIGPVDAALWLWQFRRWKVIKHMIHVTTLVMLLSLWITENVFLHKLNTFSSFFAIAFSYAIVVFSIRQLTCQINEQQQHLLRNAKFLIGCGSILFFTNRILVESFYLQDVQFSNGFLSNVFSILALINLIVNLLFAMAALWIPVKQKFSLPYSWQQS